MSKRAWRPFHVTSVAIASIVLACAFAGALLGMYLRAHLPEAHLNDAVKDVARLVTGLIATLAALVLGLLIASAKTSFDALNDGFRQSAAKVVLLDRTLAQFGSESADIRASLRSGFEARIAKLAPTRSGGGAGLESPAATVAMEHLEQRIRALSPRNDTQCSLQSRN